MSVESLICGLAVPFGERSEDGASEFERGAFERFVELERGLPLMFRHEAVIESRGVTQTIGTAREFALLEATSVHPAGLAVLGQLEATTPMCGGILRAVQRGELTGLSLRLRHDPELGIAWPVELSICHDPAFERARIIAHGARSLTVWELLTGRPARFPWVAVPGDRAEVG